MPYSNPNVAQCGAHKVTADEQTAGAVVLTVNVVNPVSYNLQLSRSNVITALTGAVITLAVGTETSGAWSSGTLTVANGSGGLALTAGDVLYWMVA